MTWHPKMGTPRRDFLHLAAGAVFLPQIASVSTAEAKAPGKAAPQSTSNGRSADQAFEPLPYTAVDELSLAKGFSWTPLASVGDIINAKGDRFGDCCDFTAFLPGDDAHHGFLWVNHEYIVPFVHAGRRLTAADRTRAAIDAEQKLVGGSLLEIRRQPPKSSLAKPGPWQLVSNSVKAFRIDATTPLPLVGPAGGRTARGTMGNCGGGTTPWGTILSGEENVDIYYTKELGEDSYGWGRFYDVPEEDYGWVVEIDPKTGTGRKLTALGRFAHEGATVAKAKDGRVVVYMGDDAAGQCLYKFVSTGRLSGDASRDKELLLEGQLFCADLKAGAWRLLSPENPKLTAAGRESPQLFGSLAAILRNARAAAKVAGGTPLNRPEDIKIHPQDATVYFALTNNASAGDFHGQVVMLQEDNKDHGAMAFTYDSYLVGGPSRGFSCPDNLCFGPGDSLWVCTDISGTSMGKGVHASFARNSVVRLEHDPRTKVTQARHFLQTPFEAEVTGPSFSPDGSTFFLSIQHPGEFSFQLSKGFSSHWPRGGSHAPLSTVIAVTESGASFKA
jgi:secreted PhoX family phosphatase